MRELFVYYRVDADAGRRHGAPRCAMQRGLRRAPSRPRRAPADAAPATVPAPQTWMETYALRRLGDGIDAMPRGRRSTRRPPTLAPTSSPATRHVEAFVAADG